MKINLGAERRAAQNCQACDLYRNATQTVFGEGPGRARLMLVGEQPGNKEDLEGHPFMGPAGGLIDQLCEELAIPRGEIYVTNAVKHFKWKRAGKVRLHQKPNAAEIRACRPWLEKEVLAVRPRVILCLGATATQSVLGYAAPIASSRGKKLHAELMPDAIVMVTWHPSAVLRSPMPEGRAEKRSQLKKDLQRAWRISL